MHLLVWDCHVLWTNHEVGSEMKKIWSTATNVDSCTWLCDTLLRCPSPLSWEALIWFEWSSYLDFLKSAIGLTRQSLCMVCPRCRPHESLLHLQYLTAPREWKKHLDSKAFIILPCCTHWGTKEAQLPHFVVQGNPKWQAIIRQSERQAVQWDLLWSAPSWTLANLDQPLG